MKRREDLAIKDKIRMLEEAPQDKLYLYDESTGEYKPVGDYEKDLLIRYNAMVLNALYTLVPNR